MPRGWSLLCLHYLFNIKKFIYYLQYNLFFAQVENLKAGSVIAGQYYLSSTCQRFSKT